jgi:hypothetical protein
MTLPSGRRERGALRRPLLDLLLDAVSHDARLQGATDEAQHLRVRDPPGDPRQQSVLLDTIEEGIQVDVHDPRRTVGEGLACRLDRLMGRAPRPKAEAVIVEVRVEDGREHLQQGLLDQPIQCRRHPSIRIPPEGLGISTLLTGCGR